MNEKSEPTPEQTPERIAQRKNLREWVEATIDVFVAPLGVEANDEAIDTLTEVVECRAQEIAKAQVDALTATLAHLMQERDELERLNHKWLIDYGMLAKSKEQAEATLARVTAQRDGLRTALVKVRAHTGYVNPTDELLRGLLQSIERIADAALVDPPVSPIDRCAPFEGTEVMDGDEDRA